MPRNFRGIVWVCDWLLENYYVDSLQALGTLLDREFDPLALFQIAISFHGDGGVVDEDVRAIFL